MDNTCLTFCLSELNTPKRSLNEKLTLFTISSLFVAFIFLTDSRNAILGLLISSPIILGISNLVWYLPLIFSVFSFLALTILPIFPYEIRTFMEGIIPSRIYTLFPQVGFNDLTSYPRINKWFSSINLITKSPIFGFGAASFPILYSFKEERFEHSHNLPLEMALSYGFITSFIIFLFMRLYYIYHFKKISSLSKLNNLELGCF